MTNELPELSVPKRNSFSDPNTALKFRDIIKEFSESIIQDAAVRDRYGYILNITQDGPEYPSSTIEQVVTTDENGNPVDTEVVPNSIDNPERASYASIITDDGFKIRARIAPTQIPVFRKAEFFDKFAPAGEGVMIDERGVYVHVYIENGISKVHQSSFPWLLEQNGEKVIVEPQVAPRVHVSGKAGQYYVVSVLRGETPTKLDVEFAKREIIRNVADLQQARYDIDQAQSELTSAQLEIDQAKARIRDAETDLIAAMDDSAAALLAAQLATGESSQALLDAQAAYNEAQAAGQAAEAATISANGRNSIIHSTSDASGTTHPNTGLPNIDGDVWNKYDSLSTLGLLATWTWMDGAWKPGLIKSEMMYSLDLTKLQATTARMQLAVAEQIISDAAYHEVLTTDKLNAGEGNINNLVAQQFATALADIIQARIENLVVTEGANINVAVIQKLAAEVVNSGEFKTLIDTNTGLYATMDASGFRVVDSGAVSGELRTLINLGPTGLDLLTLGTGSNQVTIDNSGGISAKKISVDSVWLGGKSLENALGSHKGTIWAWNQLFGANSRSLQARDLVMDFSIPIKRGRYYRVTTSSAIVRTASASVNPMLQLHAAPTAPIGAAVTQNVVAESTVGPFSGFRSLPPMEYYFTRADGPLDYNLHYFWVTLGDLNNAGWARVEAPVHRFRMMLEDMGEFTQLRGNVYSESGGSGGVANPTRYTKRYTATAWATYFRGGGRDTSVTGPIQGRAGGSTNHRDSMFLFPSMTADLSGATIHRITLRTLAEHWWYGSGGTAAWCWHGETGIPGSAPVQNFMRNEANWPRGAAREAEIIPSEFAAWQNGTRKGFGFATSNTDPTFYGRFSANLSETWIEVEYTK